MPQHKAATKRLIRIIIFNSGEIGSLLVQFNQPTTKCFKIFFANFTLLSNVIHVKDNAGHI